MPRSVHAYWSVMQRGLGEYKWSLRTASYFALEAPQTGGKGRDLVRNDAATGHKEIVVPACAFVPEGQSEPLKVESFEFSADETKLLLYTNSKRVWRRNTRGDYWVLDLTSRKLQKVGGNAAPSTLMFAKFSPQGDRVAYVQANDIYVEDLSDGRVTRLTRGGSPTLINGTFDWAYEEEFSLQDGFRWSPDGTKIAYWQLDASGVREFVLTNYTASLYPQFTTIPYPKVGEVFSAF